MSCYWSHVSEYLKSTSPIPQTGDWHAWEEKIRSGKCSCSLSSTGRKTSCSFQRLAEKKTETAVTATAFVMLKPSKDPSVQKEKEESKWSLWVHSNSRHSIIVWFYDIIRCSLCSGHAGDTCVGTACFHTVIGGSSLINLKSHGNIRLHPA